MYSYNARIRYSECSSDRQLTLPALINLFQNCSSFHSEDAGVRVQCLTIWLYPNVYCALALQHDVLYIRFLENASTFLKFF